MDFTSVSHCSLLLLLLSFSVTLVVFDNCQLVSHHILQLITNGSNESALGCLIIFFFFCEFLIELNRHYWKMCSLFTSCTDFGVQRPPRGRCALTAGSSRESGNRCGSCASSENRCAFLWESTTRQAKVCAVLTGHAGWGSTTRQARKGAAVYNRVQ